MLQPVIVLSGHTMALGVVRALGMMGVPAVVFRYDPRDTAHLSKHVTAWVTTPHPESDEEAFIDYLLKHKKRYRDAMLIPASDETTTAVSRNKAILAQDFIVACPDWDVVKKYIEKTNTYRLAQEAGVLTPKTFFPGSLTDVEEFAESTQLPSLVKPSQSHLFYSRFGQKMFRVDSREELFAVYRRAADAGLDVVLQEIIPGDDRNVVNYNCYTWGGSNFIEFTARHIRNAPPFFGSPRVVVSEKIPAVTSCGRSILQAMGYEGYACTEFKWDARDRTYKLMEVNGRHNLSTMLAVTCGINFPWIHYRHLVCGECPTQSDYREGVYWIDLVRDVGYSVKSFRQEKYSIRQYMQPYANNHVFAILDVRDIRPFLKRCRFLIASALSKLLISFWRLRRRPVKKILAK